MFCIVTNTLLMTVVAFPELNEPDAEWLVTTKTVINYFFAGVFTVEMVLKLIALRGNYWVDNWNRFDCACVTATIVGIILNVVDVGFNAAGLASIIRIFRIARLFRLLRYKPLRPLKKLFMSLGISLVKLANVGVVACLFLVLFSILGVSLFSTAKGGDTLNEHGNFKDFVYAFITLFRASTGEAWNSIMHDLHKDEVDWFRAGDWCTPANLFDTQFKYDVLKDKCLIENPNGCVVTFWGWNPLPWVYWVGYTLFLGLVIMNVVIAVILEGYEETKSSDEAVIIDSCKNLWGKVYDPDHKMTIPFQAAMRFILEAMAEFQRDGMVEGEGFSIDGIFPDDDDAVGPKFSLIPMKYAKVFDLPPDKEVEFKAAARTVLRLCAAIENDAGKGNDPVLEDGDTVELRKLKKLETKAGFSGGGGPDSGLGPTIAAAKIQTQFRKQKSSASTPSLSGTQNADAAGEQDASVAAAGRGRPDDQQEGHQASVPPVMCWRAPAEGDVATAPNAATADSVDQVEPAEGSLG